MKFPRNEFLTTQQDLRVKSRKNALLAKIMKLLEKNGMPKGDAAFNAARISESWEIMRRLCLHVENLATVDTLCDDNYRDAILFSPETSAEITHLESNLSAFRKSVDSVGNLAEKSASKYRR